MIDCQTKYVRYDAFFMILDTLNLKFRNELVKWFHIECSKNRKKYSGYAGTGKG